MFAISKISRGALLGCTAMLITVPAIAATDVTGSLGMTATVPDSCEVASTSTLSSLTYDPLSGDDETTTQTISVTCTNTTSYNVKLGVGNGDSATVTTRLLTDATVGDTIAYGLFRDDQHANNWGVTIGTDTDTGTGSGVAQTHTVYMKILASAGVNGTTVKVGTDYTDTVTVTVTY